MPVRPETKCWGLSSLGLRVGVARQVMNPVSSRADAPIKLITAEKPASVNLVANSAQL